MAVLTRLVLVAVLVSSSSVEGIRLSMSSSIIVDGKTSTLTVRCDTDAVSTDNVYAIRITKPPSTTNLAFVDSRGTRVDTSIQQRATATGSVTPAAGSNLVLTFNDFISCSDAGDYMCAYSSQITQSAAVNYTLQAVSDPHSIEMMVRPTMSIYRVNDKVELICSGFIGKPAVGSWVWETRDVTSGSTWTSLRPGLTPVDEPPVSSGLCQMTGRSTLKFHLQAEDDNRVYRCYFRDPVYSGNFTFSIIVPPVTSLSPENSTVTQDAPVTSLSPENSTVTQGCARSVVKGHTVGAGLAVWATVTFLLTLGGQGHERLSSD